MSAVLDPSGRRVLVLGLGRFTGGVETVRFLRGEGADVIVSDTAARTDLEASAREAEALGAVLVFGRQTPTLLHDVDLVVANPAIPFDHPVLAAAEEQGLPVTTEMNLFLERVRAPVLGVTGTKGKSTTVTLLTAMLEAAGRTVHLGGNVGRSLVARVGDIAPEDLVVLELSSFQLHWTRGTGHSPHLTVVTNLFGDHLDRHGTLEHYAAAKRAALDAQGPDDVAVLPADDADVRAAGYLEAGPARRVLFGAGGNFQLNGTDVVGPGGSRVELAGWPLWGAHNLRNALAAAVAALQVDDVRPEHVRAGAMATQPLPHRLAPVAEVGGGALRRRQQRHESDEHPVRAGGVPSPRGRAGGRQVEGTRHRAAPRDPRRRRPRCGRYRDDGPGCGSPTGGADTGSRWRREHADGGAGRRTTGPPR